MKLFNKVAAIAVGVMLATGVGAGIVLGSKVEKEMSPAYAAETTITKTANQLASGKTISAGNSVTCYTSLELDSVITMSTSGSANCGSFWAQSSGSSNYEWRLYQNKSGDVTIAAIDGYIIKTVSFTFAASNSGALKDGNTALTTGTAVDVNSQSKTWTVGNSGSATNGQIKIRSVTVVYDSNGESTKTTTETAVTAAGGKTTLDVTASPADTVQLSATVTYNSGASTISNPGITWSSDNTSVATVSNTGLVTAVSTGVAEITASYAGDNTYAGSSGKKTITVANPNEVVFESAHNQGNSSGQYEDTITVSDISMHCTSMHDQDTSGYRFYQNSTLTFTRVSGKIASIDFTGVSSYPISRLSVAAGSTGTLTTNGNNGTWEGAANTVSFVASAQARATKIVITYYTGADADLDKTSLVLTAGGSSSTVGIKSLDGVTSPSYSWSVSSGDDCVTLSNTTSATVTVAPKAKFAACILRVTINGTNLAEAITRDVSVNVVRASSSGSPYDINEAKRAVDYNDSTYTETAYIAGIVSQVDNYDSTHKSITYWISDDGTTVNQFEVYSGKGISGADFEALSDVLVGAEVVVKGSIKKYNSDYEFNYNNELVSYIAPDYETYKVTYSAPDKDGGTVPTDHNSYRDDAEVTVLGNTGDLTRDGYVFTGWSDGTTTYSAGETFIIHDNVTLTAVWSEVIGTNVTMAAGDNGSTCKVNGHDGIKVGTSSKGGDMTITVPAGTTKIKLYAAAWNGVNGLSLDITGATVTPASIDLTADSGVANSSPFTLNGETGDYEFFLELSNINAETTITLASSIAKRFVVWGATDLFADAFASDFLTKLVCNSEGTSQPTYTNSYSWSKFNAIYNSLDDDEKAKLHDATANQSGTDIQKAMAKYDYIVGKYLKGQGIASYNDFIGRDPAKIGASRSLNMFNEETGTAAAMVVVVVSAVSVTALGGFFLLKKKPF